MSKARILEEELKTDDIALYLIELQLSVFKWFETDGLISERRDRLIGFKV